MALSLYDNALLDKIKKWVKEDVTITGPDETRRLFEYVADTTEDKPIKLPLISLRRGRDITIQNTSKRPLTYDGATIAANLNKSIQLNAIPITIRYQLDIYTRYFKECDEFIRDFTFKLINFPTIKFTVPYNNINQEIEAHIKISDTITDNSDITERLSIGQFTRFTFNLEIDDAYLFSVPIRDNVTMEIENEIDVSL